MKPIEACMCRAALAFQQQSHSMARTCCRVIPHTSLTGGPLSMTCPACPMHPDWDRDALNPPQGIFCSSLREEAATLQGKLHGAAVYRGADLVRAGHSHEGTQKLCRTEMAVGIESLSILECDWSSECRLHLGRPPPSNWKNPFIICF